MGTREEALGRYFRCAPDSVTSGIARSLRSLRYLITHATFGHFRYRASMAMHGNTLGAYTYSDISGAKNATLCAASGVARR